MTLNKAKRICNSQLAYSLKVVMCIALLVIFSTIALNIHGNPSYAQLTPFKETELLCPTEVVLRPTTTAEIVPIVNGLVFMNVGDAFDYEMIPDKENSVNVFMLSVIINTDPEVASDGSGGLRPVFGTILRYRINALSIGKTEITWEWGSADTRIPVNGECSVTVSVGGPEIMWDVTGWTLDLVVCKNKTNGQKVRIEGVVNVQASGSCKDLGLAWDQGDNIQVKAVGFVDVPFVFGGVVTGIDANLLVCKIRSEEFPFKLRIENPLPSWNWGEIGLGADEDERVQCKAKGLAKN